MVNFFAMDEKAKCRPNGLPVLARVASVSNRVILLESSRGNACYVGYACLNNAVVRLKLVKHQTPSRSLIFK